MRAYLLAAGYGTRLGAVARDVPKPLLEVGDAPALSHLADGLAAVDELDELVLVTNSRFAGAFRAWARAHRPPRPLPIRIVDDGTTSAGERLGAARDLALALDAVPPGGAGFVVSAADYVPLFPFPPLVKAFRREGRPLLALRRLSGAEGPGRHNEVTLGKGGRIVRLREKPPDGNRTGVAAIALYFFTPDVPERLSTYLEAGGEPDAPGHFVAWLVERTPVAGAFIDGEWLDVGDPEGLEAARSRMGAEPERG